MNCDLCGQSGSGTRIGPHDMRQAVSRGFDPFSTGIVSSAVRSQWDNSRVYGSRDPLTNWKRNLVDVDQSDWNLCSRCLAAVQPYMATAPTPKGNQTWDQHIARKYGVPEEEGQAFADLEQDLRRAVFGDLPGPDGDGPSRRGR